jgi:hypothetical protein
VALEHSGKQHEHEYVEPHQHLWLFAPVDRTEFGKEASNKNKFKFPKISQNLNIMHLVNRNVIKN